MIGIYMRVAKHMHQLAWSQVAHLQDFLQQIEKTEVN